MIQHHVQCFMHVISQLGDIHVYMGEGNGTPLQYSCLENPMDGGAWQAAVNGVAKSQTRLSNFTFTHWRRKWQPTPVFLPGESQGWGSLVDCRLWDHTESDMTEVTQQQQQQVYMISNQESSWLKPSFDLVCITSLPKALNQTDANR